MKKPTLLCNDGLAARDLRKKIGLNQGEFWRRVGVTQSGGSRYESGRSMPTQVAWALHLAYGSEAQANNLLGWIRNNSTAQKQSSPASH